MEEIDCQEIKYHRAAGEVICPDCGQEYRNHPWFEKCLGYDERPFLREICDGTLVKL